MITNLASMMVPPHSCLCLPSTIEPTETCQGMLPAGASISSGSLSLLINRLLEGCSLVRGMPHSESEIEKLGPSLDVQKKTAKKVYQYVPAFEVEIQFPSRKGEAPKSKSLPSHILASNSWHDGGAATDFKQKKNLLSQRHFAF